jgi:hypothetical protein
MNATSSQDEFAKWAKLRRQHDKAVGDYEEKCTLFAILFLTGGDAGCIMSTWQVNRTATLIAARNGLCVTRDVG